MEVDSGVPAADAITPSDFEEVAAAFDAALGASTEETLADTPADAEMEGIPAAAASKVKAKAKPKPKSPASTAAKASTAATALTVEASTVEASTVAASTAASSGAPVCTPCGVSAQTMFKPQQIVFCGDCGCACPIERVRLVKKSTSQSAAVHRCGNCRSKITALYRDFGSWPPPEFAAKSTQSKQQFFKDIANKTGKEAAAQAREFLQEKTTERQDYAYGGAFLPLNVWGTRGFDVELIAAKTPACDKEMHAVLGLTYRVAIKSTSEGGSYEKSRGDESPFNSKLEAVLNKLVANTGADTSSGAAAEESDYASDSSSSSSSSSGGKKRKKRRQRSSRQATTVLKRLKLHMKEPRER